MDDFLRYGIIGMGHLGTAIFLSAIKSGLNYRQFRATVSDPGHATCQQQQHFLNVDTDNKELVRYSDIIIICVKPLQVEQVCREINPELNPNKLIISTAAGVSFDNLASWLPGHQPLIRCMPNLPVSIHKGVVGIYCPTGEIDSYLIEIEILFQGSYILRMSETELDIIIVMTGCMPGFIAYLSQCFIEAGVRLGLDRLEITSMMSLTMEGTALMLRNTNPEACMRAVSSKGGATEAGLIAMKDSGCDQIIDDAVGSAFSIVSSIHKKVSSSNPSDSS